MSTFRFRLQSLLRYRKHRLNQCLQLLAQILAEDRSLNDQRARLERNKVGQLDELRILGQLTSLDVDAATARRYFIGQLNGQIANVDHQREIVAGQLEMCRQATNRAENEVKVLEKLREKQETAFNYEQERRTSREVDDLWLAAHFKEMLR